MNKNIGLQLVAYSLLLAGLSYLTHNLAPAPTTLSAGLIGGALCLVWGFRAMAGSPGKAPALLTLIPLNFVLLSQTVIGWGSANEGISGRLAAASATTLLLAITIGMLMRIAYAGVVFDGQPAQQMTDRDQKAQKTGNTASNAVKNA